MITKKGLTALLLAVFMCVFLNGCSNTVDANAGPVMNIDIKDGRMIYNGSEQFLFQVEENEEITLGFRIEPLQGSLKIKVYKTGEEDSPIYEGHQFPSAAFSVYADEPGDYVVLYECENFEGAYGNGLYSSKRGNIISVPEEK